MKPANGGHTSTHTHTQDDLLTALPSKLFYIMCLGVGGVSLHSGCGYWGAL